MDDTLIQLVLGCLIPAPLSIFFFFRLCHFIHDLPALFRAKNEPFKPVECEVVGYNTFDEDTRGYHLIVKRLDGVTSKELIPCNYFNNQEETMKKYVGCQMTFYAKDSAPTHLFCEKDITSQDTMEKEIKSTLGSLLFSLLFLLLFLSMIIREVRHIRL